MKKTQKNILGISGLFLVVATTFFAASLPEINALAATSNSVTDTITVRVVGDKPNVDVTGIESGEESFSPEQNFSINYENIETLSAVFKYTDADGNVQEITLLNESVGYNAGSAQLTIDLESGTFVYGGNTYPLPVDGFGDYTLVVTGTGYGGVFDEQTINFSYVPIKAEIVTDDDTGEQAIEIEYSPIDPGVDDDNGVASIVVNVYDENGNLVTPMSPIRVTPPTNKIDLPFAEYDLPSGTYTVEVIALNRNDEELHKKYFKVVYRKIPVPSTGAPDTGGIMGELNISKTDYIITGLIVFGLVGTTGAILISKHDKKSSKRR